MSNPSKSNNLSDLESSPLWRKAVALAEQAKVVAQTIPHQENYSFADPIYRMSITLTSDIAMAIGKGSGESFDLRFARGHLFTVKGLVLMAEKYGFATDTKHFLRDIEDFQKTLDAAITETEEQDEAALKGKK